MAIEDIKAIKERLVKMKKLEVVDVKTTTSTIRLIIYFFYYH